MPDAPQPTYNSNGRPMGDWLVVCRYDSIRDVLTLSWTQDATPWSRRGQGASAFPSTDLVTYQDAVRQQLEILAQPRLF